MLRVDNPGGLVVFGRLVVGTGCPEVVVEPGNSVDGWERVVRCVLSVDDVVTGVLGLLWIAVFDVGCSVDFGFPVV